MTSIVVTGFGATTPIGGDAASTWAAMLAGTSGAATIEDDWAADLPVRFAAHVAVDPLDVLDRVEARRMDRSGQLAMIAAREAWAHTGRSGHRQGTARCRRRVRDRRLAHHALRVRHAARERGASGVAARDPDAHAEQRGCLRRPRGRCQSRRAHARERVRLGKRGDRVRRRHDPQRSRRHRAGRWH